MIGKPAETTFVAATILHSPFLRFLDEHLTSLREAQANYPRAVPIRLFLSGLTDAHDRDAAHHIIERYRGELDIELLTESTQLACSAARNRVNLGVGSRWTAFFDVDVTLAPQYFGVLAEAIDTVESNAPKVRALAGGLGCRDATPIGDYEYLMDLYAYYAKIQNQYIDVQHVDLRDVGSARGAIPSSLDEVAYERVIYLQGCNHVLNREIFDELGGHDVRFSGSDDRHMAGKIISSGYEIAFVPGCIVDHYYNFTIADIGRRKYKHGYHSAAFKRKYAPAKIYDSGVKMWLSYTATLFDPPTTFRSIGGWAYFTYGYVAFAAGTLVFHLQRALPGLRIFRSGRSSYSFARAGHRHGSSHVR